LWAAVLTQLRASHASHVPFEVFLDWRIDLITDCFGGGE